MKNHTFLALICLSLSASPLFGQTTASTDSSSIAPIPEEARRHYVMGTTLFKDAKTADDFTQVVNEFKQASDLAPQWPDARYNLALTREAAGDYSGAMADLKIYQQFKLSDYEARAVQDKIYSLEAKEGAIAKKQEAAAVAEREYQDKIGFLAGTWNCSKIIYCNCPLNGQESSCQEEITISGKNIFIGIGDQIVLKGTIAGEDYATINWFRIGKFVGHDELPNCPVDVTIDKDGHKIGWKEPGCAMNDAGQWNWDWQMGYAVQLTQ